VTTLEAAPWLRLSRESGEIGANGNVDLRLSAVGLAPGTYTTRLRVDAVGTVNPGFTVLLTFTVTPRAITGVRYRFDRIMGNAPTSTPLQENVPAAQASALNTRAAARDAQGNIYVMIERRLRRIDANGRITTIAGDGTEGETADGTPALQAKFRFIDDLAVGRDGTVYLREGIGALVYALKDGMVRVAISRNSNVLSSFSSLRGMCTSPSGNVYVHEGSRIIRLDSARPPEQVSGFGNFSNAAGASLFDCAAESDNSWVLSDTLGNRVFRWSSAGLTLLAGTRIAGLSGDGGPGAQAQVSSPAELVVDMEGNVIFSDRGNRRLRLIRPDGRIFTLTGRQSSFGLTTGLVAATEFTNITSLALEPNGGLLVTTISSLDRFTRLPFGTPVLQTGSVVNGASQLAALSPGSLVTVYGVDLALETRAANFSPLALALGGAEILLNGQPIPIVFASQGQVNAQIPPAAAPGAAKIRARVDGKQSAEIDVQILPAAPGIFVYGANRAVAQNQDGAINGEASPEAVGNFAVLYFTGIGATDDPVAAGALAPSSPLARAANPAELRVGESVANVLFVGLSPGFIGLGQVNFQVPEMDPGSYPITLRIAGQVSNAPLFAVKAP
jgi:uncharacterized protein (TIGR03437 family)